jgi:hypothetical protein
LYPSLPSAATTAPSVPLLRVLVTKGVIRFLTLNRFTLADVSWSRLLRPDELVDEVVDEVGRRRRRLPPENEEGQFVNSRQNTL